MDIVMIPFHDCKKWIGEGFRTRDAHLAEHFCTDLRVGKVLVINRPTSLAEMLIKCKKWNTSKFSSQAQVIEMGNRYEIGRLNDKLYYLDTFLPDFIKVIFERKMWWVSAFQNKFVLNNIRNAIKELKLKSVVILLQNPMAVEVVELLDYECFAFDAIDNWLHHPQMKSNHVVIEKNYKFVDENADVIFTVSKALTEVFGTNKNTNWVANGVDAAYFSSALEFHGNEKKFTIGYIGKIQDRVDFDLVEKCLKEFSNYEFIFIGPIYSQHKRIKKLQKNYTNIEFLGNVHYSELPCTMKKIDVAIIPHKVDAFTESMNPLKLYEYLAAGKPVVTTGVAGTDDISDYIFMGNNLKFIQLLGTVSEKVISREINPKKVVKSIPAECTWDYRTSEILDILDKVLIEGRING